MSFDNRKYIYLAIAAVIAAVALYMTYSLIKDGSPSENKEAWLNAP